MKLPDLKSTPKSLKRAAHAVCDFCGDCGDTDCCPPKLGSWAKWGKNTYACPDCLRKWVDFSKKLVDLGLVT